MKPDKEDVEEVRNQLQQELNSSGNITTSKVVEILTSEYTEGHNLNYIIWRYGDKSRINHHFRDFGYENPDDLIESLENMEGKKGRNLDRELKGLVNYTLDEIYNSLD